VVDKDELAVLRGEDFKLGVGHCVLRSSALMKDWSDRTNL
jgi:hypothetical protein